MDQNKIYNMTDGFVGHWVEDQPYFFVGTSYKTGKRSYLEHNKYTKLEKGLSKCQHPVKNYFLVTDKSKQLLYKNYFLVTNKSKQLLYRNGRRFYRTNTPIIGQDKNKIHYPSEKSIQLCRELSPFRGVTIDIASLICSHLSGEKSWPEIYNVLEKCSPGSD